MNALLHPPTLWRMTLHDGEVKVSSASSAGARFNRTHLFSSKQKCIHKLKCSHIFSLSLEFCTMTKQDLPVSCSATVWSRAKAQSYICNHPPVFTRLLCKCVHCVLNNLNTGPASQTNSTTWCHHCSLVQFLFLSGS